MSEDPESQETTQRAEHPQFLTQTKFDDFDLPPEVKNGLKEAKFTYCTPIQAQVLPVSLAGRDVAGQAQTGTGKTAAFLVTIFTRLLSLPQRKDGLPSALIVAPTRELALQIYGDAEILGRHTGLSLAQVVGGIDYQKQADILREGADIVICTPGRIIDYLKQGIFKTADIKVVVIDEADRLFDLGFTKDTRYILRRLPHYEKRLSMLFSATLSYRVLALTYDYMNLPEFISVTPEDVTVEGVEQSLFHVGSDEKLSLLLGLLEREEWSRILIFVNTKAGVNWLSQKLKGNRLPAEGITGDLPQRQRLRLMERFKGGRIKILVATDVASRGIHVEDISHIINYDLPQDAQSYTHRIGRTARAGKTGRAISLVCEDYVFHLEPIEEMLGYKIPVVWPGDDWFKKDKAGPVSTERKGRAKRPPREKRRQKMKKTTAPRKRGMPTSLRDQPGGIFGLAPHPKKTAPEKESTADQEKTRKKKRRKGRGKRAT
ncbi:MAG: DEAD/DEAH box helicase [Desulfobacteraceae bacterium]|jgi:ATP-dependent RNA helicase RhlB